MRLIISTLVFFIFFIGCSEKEPQIKNPEMTELNNVNVSFVKGGEFLMGTYEDKFSDKPPRKVILKDFYIDKYEVTNAAYKQYMSEATAVGSAVRTPDFTDDPILGVDTLPVVGVTHAEAQAFCTYYGKRLPTEAEWEYAAKGGTTNSEYFWGKEANPLYMNFRDSKKSMPVSIGSYPPNAYQIYDMHGNVREWVADTYERDFYKTVCKKKEQTIWGMITGTYDMVKEYLSDDGYVPNTCYYNPINKANSKYKSVRGGSYDYSKGYPATLSFRFFEEYDSTHKDLGFRCATYEKSDQNDLLSEYKESEQSDEEQ